jgi:ubiquinone biosynthesis protein COQ9
MSNEDPARDGGDELERDRMAILAAALDLVPFEGWTVPMLRRATVEAGCTRDRQLLAFPRGVVDLVCYYSDRADRAMAAILAETDLEPLKVRERVALGVRSRIEALADSKDAARRASGFLASPLHAATGMNCVYRTVDAIWRGIGDRSTDFNFYSKRALLAGVYTTTLMHWFSNRSDDSADTWAFLDRRIADVLQFQKSRAKAEAAAAKLPDPFRVIAGLGRSGRARR